MAKLPKKIKKTSQRKIVTRALNQIAGKEGKLTPERVVDEASSPAHPLHKYFEWDDSVAARKFRIEQARELIRWASVKVQVKTESLDVSAFVRDRSLDRQDPGYVSVLRLNKRPTEARQAVVAEFEQVAGHLRRARDLAVALGYAHEIESLIQDVLNLSKRIGGKEAA